MISVTHSLESLQQVIANQRAVIEELRHAGRPSGEPLEELQREMDAMTRMHEARMRQEQERTAKVQQQLAEAQNELSSSFMKTQHGVDSRIADMEKELGELRSDAREATARLPEEMAKVCVCVCVCMCALLFE
jgi:hypothetical protein